MDKQQNKDYIVRMVARFDLYILVKAKSIDGAMDFAEDLTSLVRDNAVMGCNNLEGEVKESYSEISNVEIYGIKEDF
ncbi:MAG: hypothetical protein HUJ83_05880 [Veillonella sp.]|nr:hypothetical protein [Veillonella sp.]